MSRVSTNQPQAYRSTLSRVLSEWLFAISHFLCESPGTFSPWFTLLSSPAADFCGLDQLVPCLWLGFDVAQGRSLNGSEPGNRAQICISHQTQVTSSKIYPLSNPLKTIFQFHTSLLHPVAASLYLSPRAWNSPVGIS